MQPRVLKIGKVHFAQEKWDQFSKTVEVVECESTNREQFIADLHDKYSDVTHITRTYHSTEQTGRFDEELVQHFPKSVQTVSHCGAGYDQVDVEPLTKRNIQLSNVTRPVESPTADTAIYLVLSTLRNYQVGHNGMKEWPNKAGGGAQLGRSPESQTIGILGLGGIGKAIGKRLVPFGFKKVIYHNRGRVDPELENGAEFVSYEELITTSDIICISIPLNAETRHSIDNEAMAKMKRGVILINTARGAIINEQHLIENLKSGQVAKFGSDVFEHEPNVPHELIDMEQVVSLPHMGTYSIDATRNMEEWVVENVECHLKTGKVKTIVPEQQGLEFNHQPLLK
jgi:gluconate 2-dehydrogenase